MFRHTVMVDTVLFFGVTKSMEQLPIAFVACTLRVGASSGSIEIDDEGVTREPPLQNSLPLTLWHLLALLLRMMMMMMLLLVWLVLLINTASLLFQCGAPLPCQTRGAAPPGSPCQYRRLKKCKKKHKGIVLKMKKKAVTKSPLKIVTFSNLNARRKQCKKFTKIHFFYKQSCLNLGKKIITYKTPSKWKKKLIWHSSSISLNRGVALHRYLGPCVQLQFLEALGTKLENRR